MKEYSNYTRLGSNNGLDGASNSFIILYPHAKKVKRDEKINTKTIEERYTASG